MSQLRVNNFSNHFVLDVKINATNILHCFIYMYCQYWLFIVQHVYVSTMYVSFSLKENIQLLFVYFVFHCMPDISIKENYFAVIAILKTNKEITPF